MRKLILPAHEDPCHSVDLFDADRRNQWGELYCIRPAVLLAQVEESWQNYLKEGNHDEPGNG